METETTPFIMAKALACQRCGRFLPPDRPWRPGRALECAPCEERRRAQLRTRRLYPPAYITVLGIAASFTVAAVLAALNWQALEDNAQARQAWGAAVAGATLTGGAVALRWPLGLLCLANIAATVAISASIKDLYEQHREAGGARANLLWPLLGVAGVMLTCAALVAALRH